MVADINGKMEEVMQILNLEDNGYVTARKMELWLKFYNVKATMLGTKQVDKSMSLPDININVRTELPQSIDVEPLEIEDEDFEEQKETQLIE